MRRISLFFIVLLIGNLWISPAGATIARGGGGFRPQVGNRSANINRSTTATRSGGNTANINRSTTATGSVNSANVHRNINVNNVDVNRNVDVHGWGGNYWVDDNNWGWGSFAAGAAIGATTAAVGSAAAHKNDVTVVAPAMGTVVTTLPGSCSTIATGGTVLYSCGGVYYQPSYHGSSLVYQVVPQP